MASLNCISINKLTIFASTEPNKVSSPSIPHPASSSPNPSLPSLNTATPVQSPPQTLREFQNQQPKQKQNKKKSQPSVLEIERAIGAGIFKDREPRREREENENANLFDTVFSRTIGKTEWPLEKRLRETGEWINDKTEKKFRSAGKPILMFMYLWILPTWILAFCIASGIIKLPFHNAWLDDLLM